MKILYIHQYFRVNDGGLRSLVLSKCLTDNEHEVIMLTQNDFTDEKKLELKNKFNIDIRSTKTNYDHKMGFIRRIIAFLHFMFKAIILGLKEDNLDLIYATSTPLTVGFSGMIIGKLKSVKYIFEVRDVWPDVPIELGYINNKIFIKLLKYLEKKIYNGASYIVALSEGMKDNIIKKGDYQDKISVIPNIANINLYEDKINEIENKELLNFVKNNFVCIHPGTMGFVNGVNFILDVAEILKEKDFNEIKFLLIGKGKERDKIIKRRDEKELNNVIINERIPKYDIVNVIKESDIGLMVVRNEFKILEDNSANKFFDYLAAGLPVIINYEGWQKDVLEEYKAGFSALKPEEMADRIIELYKDKSLRLKFAKNSRGLADKYSNVSACKKLVKIVDNL